MRNPVSSVLRAEAAACLALAALAGAFAAQAQEPAPTPFIEAQRAEAHGEFTRAEQLYDTAVARDPNDTAALFGRARMRSWLGRFPEAIADYQAGIKRQPDNPQALSGLAWTYAWSHHFDEASAGFQHLAQVEPYYLDAKKGLAYVALWRGDARDARRQFEDLASQDRDNPDYALALGQAAYQEGDLPAARAAFTHALQLKPGLTAASSGLRATDAAEVQRSPALTALFGRSAEGSESHSGLRYAQLGMQITPAARVWLTYDKGLGLDTFLPDRRLLNSSTTLVGGFYNYAPRLAARLEAGVRKLPDETQAVVTGEQVFFMSGTNVPKVGFWWAHGSSASQWVLDASVFHRLSSRWSIEPAVYLGDDGVNRERRLAALGTYETPQHIQFGLGLALGSKDMSDGRHDVSRVFLNAAAPLGRRASLLFYSWHEVTQGFPAQTVITAGAMVYL
jgi:tetratricopeptide (TPR) repeat protein